MTLDQDQTAISLSLMNEPTEFAVRTQTGVTYAKMLLAVVREGTEGLSLHGYATPDRASYSDSFSFEIKGVQKQHASPKEHSCYTTSTCSVRVPGWVNNGHTSERAPGANNFSGVHRPLTGFWYLSGDPRDRMRDILELLPGGAEISFQVYLDAGTNELLIRADVLMTYDHHIGLHGDHLYMHATYNVRGKPKTRTFLIDTHTSAHNSARFGVR